MDQTPPTPTPVASGPAYRPDWYPDPTHRFEYRYHNGQSWTGDVAVDGNRFSDSMLAVSTLARPNPAKSGKATACLVLAVGSILVGWVPFVCVVAIAAAALALVFGIATLRQDRGSDEFGGRKGKARGLAVAGLILVPFGLAASGVGIWLTVVSIHAIDRYANVGPYSIVAPPCTVSGGVATFDGKITNESASTRTYHVAVDFVNAGTSRTVATGSTTIDDVAPNETRQLLVTEVISAERIDCHVIGVTGPIPFGQS